MDGEQVETDLIDALDEELQASWHSFIRYVDNRKESAVFLGTSTAKMAV